MTPKVTVALGSSRPGGVDISLKGLAEQTYKDFEIIFVDARYHKRHRQVIEYAKKVGLEQPLYHVPNHRYNGVWGANCVLPDTLLLGDNKAISQYQSGNQTVGKTGLQKVKNKFKRIYSGQVVNVSARGILPFTITPEHPLLVVTGRGHGKVLLSDTHWKNAGKLKPKKMGKEGDYLIIPVIKGNVDCEFLSLIPFIKNYRKFKSRPQMIGKKELLLNEDLAWLIGLYVAEGCKGTESSIFSLGTKDSDIIKKLRKIVSDIGYSSYIKRCSDTNSIYVNITSKVLSRALKTWCGNHADSKKIPDFLLYNNKITLLEQFLKGYSEGDGSIRHLQHKEIRLTTVSKILAMQLQLAYARIGVKSNIRLARKSGIGIIHGRVVSLKDSYEICCYPNSSRTLKNTEGFLTPIKSLNITHYEGEVNNIETEDNSYLVNNVITHNCAGVNTGFMLAAGEILIMLMDYAYTPPGWIEAHLKWHDKPRLVMAPHLYCEMPLFWYDGTAPPIIFENGPETTVEAILKQKERFDEISIFPRRFNSSYQFKVIPMPQNDPKSVLPTGPSGLSYNYMHTKNDSFPVKTVLDIGGMDENWDRGRGPGDTEFGYRLVSAGLEPWICAEAKVYCPNPRPIMPNLNTTIPIKWTVENPNKYRRWSYEDGTAYFSCLRSIYEQTKSFKANNPYDMMEMRKELWCWRELSQEKEAVIPLNDIGDKEYFGD